MIRCHKKTEIVCLVFVQTDFSCASAFGISHEETTENGTCKVTYMCPPITSLSFRWFTDSIHMYKNTFASFALIKWEIEHYDGTVISNFFFITRLCVRSTISTNKVCYKQKPNTFCSMYSVPENYMPLPRWHMFIRIRNNIYFVFVLNSTCTYM